MCNPAPDPRCGLTRNEAGNVVIEFALILPVLMLLAIGALEAGRLFMEHLRMTGVARAGLQYGLQDYSTAFDMDAIRQAAEAGAGGAGAGYSIIPRKFCSCPGGEAACTTSCADGADMRTYLEVGVTGEVQLLFGFPVLPQTITLSTTQVQRLN